MGKSLKLSVLAIACVMAFGCSAKHTEHEDYSMRASQEQRFRRSYEAAFDSNDQQSSQQLLRKARSAIGTPYVPGGMSPGGFDCSGFVCWAYKSVGVNLPRTAQEQSVVGQRINNVEDMQVGDIVAFRHPRRGYHTGIYVGDGKFIHSPHRRTTVRINSLDDPYFKGTFLGARRVKMAGTENLVAEAESRLSDFAEEKAVRDISHKNSASSRNGKMASKEQNKRDGKEDKDRKSPSKSHDKFVEVASIEKPHQSTRKIDVQKSDKASEKATEKSSNKASKDSKSEGKAKSGSSASENSKQERKAESHKAESAKSEAHKSGEHKAEAAKSESKHADSKPQASKSNSSKQEKASTDKSGSSKQEKASADKNKSDHSKVADKSDNGKNKKNPSKKRENDS
jgi:hypothetical protein